MGDFLNGDGLEGEDSPEGIDSWFVSYGDLMTVLVVFLLLMMSPQAVLTDEQNKSKEKLISVLEEISEVSKEKDFENLIKIEQEGNTGKITLINKLIFDSAKAVMKEDQLKILNTILDSLLELNETHSFSIVGHTDSNKIYSHKFRSNWHLSTTRALTILEEFIKKGFEQKTLSAQGFAEFQPFVSEYDDKGNLIKENQALNRRVEIFIQ